MTLREISSEYIKAMDGIEVNEDGEIVNLEELESLKDELQVKVENVALYILNIEDEAKTIKEIAEGYAARAKAKENKAKRMREYLSMNMQNAEMDKFETANVALSFRKSEKIVINDEFAIPEMYLRKKVTTEPDKTLIKKAIKEGAEVSGAQLVTSKNLKID